jgi:hypothetical protein
VLRDKKVVVSLCVFIALPVALNCTTGLLVVLLVLYCSSRINHNSSAKLHCY